WFSLSRGAADWLTAPFLLASPAALRILSTSSDCSGCFCIRAPLAYESRQSHLAPACPINTGPHDRGRQFRPFRAPIAVLLDEAAATAADYFEQPREPGPPGIARG